MAGARYLAASVLGESRTGVYESGVCLSFLVESHRHGGGDDVDGGV